MINLFINYSKILIFLKKIPISSENFQNFTISSKNFQNLEIFQNFRFLHNFFQIPNFLTIFSKFPISSHFFQNDPFFQINFKIFSLENVLKFQIFSENLKNLWISFKNFQYFSNFYRIIVKKSQYFDIFKKLLISLGIYKIFPVSLENLKKFPNLLYFLLLIELNKNYRSNN